MLLQVLIFASHHILTQNNCPDGFLLLKLLCSYLELDMYASLTVHTDVTIELGKAEFLRFDEVLQVSAWITVVTKTNLLINIILRLTIEQIL
jgi:hypothetical protein